MRRTSSNSRLNTNQVSPQSDVGSQLSEAELRYNRALEIAQTCRAGTSGLLQAAFAFYTQTISFCRFKIVKKFPSAQGCPRSGRDGFMCLIYAQFQNLQLELEGVYTTGQALRSENTSMQVLYSFGVAGMAAASIHNLDQFRDGLKNLLSPSTEQPTDEAVPQLQPEEMPPAPARRKRNTSEVNHRTPYNSEPVQASINHVGGTTNTYPNTSASTAMHELNELRLTAKQKTILNQWLKKFGLNPNQIKVVQEGLINLITEYLTQENPSQNQLLTNIQTALRGHVGLRQKSGQNPYYILK